MIDYQQYEDKVIQYRRHLHQNPEPSFKEYETTKYIRDVLRSLEHCEVIELTETGTIGVFNKGGNKKLVCVQTLMHFRYRRSVMI